jgi:hypothetical protein
MRKDSIKIGDYWVTFESSGKINPGDVPINYNPAQYRPEAIKRRLQETRADVE